MYVENQQHNVPNYVVQTQKSNEFVLKRDMHMFGSGIYLGQIKS